MKEKQIFQLKVAYYRFDRMLIARFTIVYLMSVSVAKNDSINSKRKLNHFSTSLELTVLVYVATTSSALNMLQSLRSIIYDKKGRKARQ